MSIGSDFSHSIPGLNQIMEVVTTQTQQPTGADVWEETKDTLSQSELSNVDQGIEFITPTLPFPKTSFSPVVTGANELGGMGKILGLTDETKMKLLQGGQKDLSNMESFVENLSKFLPKDHPGQVSIKAFMATIHAALDKLKEILNLAGSTEAKVKEASTAEKAATNEAKSEAQSKASLGETDNTGKAGSTSSSDGTHKTSGPSKPMTLDESLKLRKVSRDKLAAIGSNKGAATVTAIILTLLGSASAISLLMMVASFIVFPPLLIFMSPILVPMIFSTVLGAAVGLGVGVPELAPGSSQGYMEKADNTRLQKEKEKNDAIIMGSVSPNDSSLQTDSGTSTKSTSGSIAATATISKHNLIIPPTMDSSLNDPTGQIDIAAIQQMIHVLMQMLAKILLGVQTGQISIPQMQTNLSGVHTLSIPPELQQQMTSLQNFITPFSMTQTNDPGVYSNEQLTQALTALTLYNYHNSTGDLANAQTDLTALNQSLYNLLTPQGDMSMIQTTTDIFKNALEGNIGTPVNVQYRSA